MRATLTPDVPLALSESSGAGLGDLDQPPPFYPAVLKVRVSSKAPTPTPALTRRRRHLLTRPASPFRRRRQV